MPLGEKFTQSVIENGPMTVAEYMTLALHDSDHGYYRGREVLGQTGDFVTAPEICQVFGELIGIWCAALLHTMGPQSRYSLVELGPGRGTLMVDLLRTLSQLGITPGNLDVHLVECSATLREQQGKALAHLATTPIWHDTIDALVDTLLSGAKQPCLLTANEFLDALPIDQFIHDGTGWRLRRVGLDEHNEPALLIAEPCEPGELYLPHGCSTPQSGDIFERRGGDVACLERLADLAGGVLFAGLFIDYGHARTAIGETLQGVRNHAYVDPLSRPGATDLSAHVDFALLQRVIHSRTGVTTSGPILQAELLTGLGIAERSAKLHASATSEQAGLLETGIARLMAPQGMGARFKALVVRSTAILPPLPFANV